MSAATPRGGDAAATERTPVKGNPGWAGETGEFAHLTEDDVRGNAYVGVRPLEGGHPGGAASYPYQIAERDPEAPLFEGPYRERFEKILTRYPDKQGALLPVLNLAQEVRGHLSPDAMNRVAELLELAPAYVRGVATFYTMYNKRPVGRYLVQVCTNVCCNVCGADDVAHAFLEELGVDMGDVSADGLFTVMEAECLGACGFPTAVQINNRYFENVEPAAVPDLIRRLREDGVSTPQPARGAAGAGAKAGAAGAGARAGAGAAGAATGAAATGSADAADRPATPQAQGQEKAGGGKAPEETVRRAPAVPPTEEPTAERGPAGGRATGNAEAHQPEDAGGAPSGPPEDAPRKGQVGKGEGK